MVKQNEAFIYFGNTSRNTKIVFLEIGIVDLGVTENISGLIFYYVLYILPHFLQYLMPNDWLFLEDI